PDGVAPEAPADRVALLHQASTAQADLIRRSHLEAAVMEADGVGLRECHDMVVAVAACAHERDHILRAVREPHAERAREKLHAAQNVRGEQQNVPQAHRPDWSDGGFGRNGAPILANHAARTIDLEWLAGRLWLLRRRVVQMDAQPVWVLHPQAGAGEAWRRLDHLASQVRDGVTNCAELLRVRA